MAVLPGSLDYLYYNGIIDHIPYEAYELSPITPSGMAQMSGMSGMGHAPMMYGYNNAQAYQANATQYLKAAQKGLLYNTYTYPDTFVGRNGSVKREYRIKNKAFQDGEGYSRNYDAEVMAYGQEGKNFRLSMKEKFIDFKEKFANSPTWMKGLLAGGVILTTICCLLGKRAPKVKA